MVVVVAGPGSLPGTLSSEARTERALRQLAALGVRRTVARRHVLGLLAGVQGHLSAMQIHHLLRARGAEVDLSTVHRTMVTLTELGLVHGLPTGTLATYGMADVPHQHAVCRGCAQVVEVPSECLASATASVEVVTGFRLGAADLMIFGWCPACR